MNLSFKKLTPTPDADHGVPCSRSSHGVSVIDKGSRLVLYGGEHVARTPLLDDAQQACCWVVEGLNTDQPIWKRIVSDTADVTLPPPRVAHAQAADVENGNVYLFGGRCGIGMNEAPLDDLWVLDTKTFVWSKVEIKAGTPPEARSFHKMICIGDILYVFGGCGTSGRLADLHSFNLTTQTWTSLGTSLLRGRGGPNVIPIDSGKKIAVVAGFAGEETADGHIFDIATQQWEKTLMEKELEPMRPRSVCVSGSFPSSGVSVIFGGEVDPSDRGHEGAGGFTNDIVLLDEKLAHFYQHGKLTEEIMPESRGWSDADTYEDDAGVGYMYIFGGLTGDDINPVRLDDLWRLQIQK